MSGITIKLSDAELKQATKGFGIIPKGTYDAEIVSAELRKVKSGKNEGKDMLGVGFKIINDDEYEGRRVWANVCLWYGAHFTLVQLLTALGHDMTDGELNVPEPEDLIGEQMPISVGVRIYNEQEQNEVKRILKPEGAGGGKAKKNIFFD